MNETKERLVRFLKYLRISQGQFAEKIGLSRGYVNNMTGNPTQKILNKITDVYPELNINWLLSGEGSMLKPVSAGDNNSINNSNNSAIATGGGNIRFSHQNVSEPATGYAPDISRDAEIEKLRALITEKDNIIIQKDTLLKAKDDIIKAKNDIIQLLMSQLSGK